MDIGFQNVSWKDLPQLLECMRENYTADRLGFDPDVARSAWLEVLDHEELGRAWNRQNVRAQNLYRKVGFQDHDHYLLTKWISQ